MGTSTHFIKHPSDFLETHLKEAAISEELGQCMNDVTLNNITHTWPLVTYLYLIHKLFGRLYNLAESSVSEVVLDPRLWLTI